MLKRGLGVAVVTVATVIGAGSAFAASDVSNTPTLSNQLLATSSVSIASFQTSSIISTAATGGFTAGTGGFSAGGTGGFSGGGTGGFSGGGTGGGTGGFNSGGSGTGGGFGNSPPTIKPQNYTPPAAEPGALPSGQQVDSGVGMQKSAARRWGATGASAGDDGQRLGLWSNFAGQGFSQDQTSIQSSGQVYTFMVGADYRINDWVIAGLSAGYEHQNINSTYNQGTWVANGGTVAPYAVVQLIPGQLFLDATVGYTGNSIDITRNSSAITGSTSGNRYFVGSNLTAALGYERWAFRPQVGVSYSYQNINGYQESGAGGTNVDDVGIHFGRFSAGGQAGYSFEQFQPYLMAMYQYDFKYDLPAPAIAYKNSALVGGGLLLAITPRLSGGFQFGAEVGKTDWIAYTGSGTIRYAF